MNLNLLFRSIKIFRHRNGASLAAGLAYYSLFALVSVFVLSLIIITQIFGDSLSSHQFGIILRNSVDIQTYTTVKTAVERAYALITLKGWGLVSLSLIFWSIFSWSRTLHSAFVHLTKKSISSVPFTFQFKSFLVIILMGIFLTVFNAEALINWLSQVISISGIWNQGMISLARIMISLLLLSFCLSLIYLFFSPQKISYSSCLRGSLYTSLIVLLGRLLLDLLIQLYRFPQLFGTAGVVVIYLYWLYYFAQIILLGMIIVQQIDKS